jgi:D,D-heptose 1,7-bisphosphate phosphatase
MNNKAVFFDKDGTLIDNVPYNVDPEKVRLASGALEGVRLLHEAGFNIYIGTNQSGVARGHFSEAALLPVRDRLAQLLGEVGVPLDGFYYCPHLPDAPVRNYAVQCFCRKPNPGLLFQAARDHDVNLAKSWVVGDILNDVEAGRRADCRTVLVDNGNETEWELSPLRRPHFTVTNLLDVARVILAEEARVFSPPIRRTPAKARVSVRA